MNNNIKNTEEKQQENNSILKKCTDKKKKNPKLVQYIAPLVSAKMTIRISECGDLTIFIGDKELKNFKLCKGNFCGNRFCPMCSWRLACKDSLKLSILMEHIKKEEAKEFIFLTLTTPNVKGDKLNDEIISINKAFDRLMKRKEVKSIVKGYIRKLEVTYQKEKYITKELWKKKKKYYESKGLYIGDLEPNYDTYHPHFHVVIAVNKSYFKKKDLYLTQERWLELWREATGNYDITQVDVRKATSGDHKEVYELAKYSAKDSDYLVNRSVFRTFYEALKGKRLIVYSGLFKEANKLYENGNLDVYKKQDNIRYVYIINYEWFKNRYLETRKRELTKEEFERYNKMLIDEMEVD